MKISNIFIIFSLICSTGCSIAGTSPTGYTGPQKMVEWCESRGSSLTQDCYLVPEAEAVKKVQQMTEHLRGYRLYRF